MLNLLIMGFDLGKIKSIRIYIGFIKIKDKNINKKYNFFFKFIRIMVN